ncbi:MAG: hypothetical protein D6705_08615 [Deltaproteobacteria bacterium]|nr:MAG: hypothetical protein D6705_08615 [Deltaproteobacteria bacterium]
MVLIPSRLVAMVPPPRQGRGIVRGLAAALLVIVVGLGVLRARRAYVQSWFEDGPGGPAPALPTPTAEPLLAPWDGPVRVVVLDGLREATARTLPNLDALCRRGIDLRVDVGFPTVSLPVQHVLWTGKTQQQTGIWYRIAPLDHPPPGGLPGQVPGSVAVAESHLGIAGSFGFERVIPGPRDPSPPHWAPDAFEAAAVEAFGSKARLVFVHVLRIDEAGHRFGGGSAAYAEAAATADALLGRLAAAATGARIFVLADHGHRDDGGHGGAEPTIRIVRACVAGPGVPVRRVPPRGPPIHLVDLSAALFRSVGLESPPEAPGREVAAALAAPAKDRTLPAPSWWRWVVAAIVVASAGYAGARRRRWWASCPPWFAFAAAGCVVVFGLPSLSIPAVYPPLGRDAAVAMGPGLVLAVLGGVRSGHRGTSPLPAWWPSFAVPAAVGGACIVLSAGSPPLVPRWTAVGSLVAIAVGYGSIGWGIGWSLAAIVGRAVVGRRRSDG